MDEGRAGTALYDFGKQIKLYLPCKFLSKLEKGCIYFILFEIYV